MEEYTITYINEYGVENEHIIMAIGIYGALSYFLSVCAEFEMEVDIIKIEKKKAIYNE